MSLSASEFYSAPGHPYNCAQAVAIALTNGDTGIADQWRAFGGGRAPEGLCGALYAALQHCPPEKRPEIQEAFQARVGAIRCRDIKGAATPTPCATCVAVAEEIVRSYLN